MIANMDAPTFSEPRELYEYLRLNRFDDWGDRGSADWVFRGQAKLDWPLLPSAWRPTGLEALETWRAEGQVPINRLVQLYEGQKAECLWDAFRDADNERVIAARAQYVAEFEAVRTFSRIRCRNFPSTAWGSETFDHASRTGWAAGDLIEFQYGADDYVALAQHHGVPTRLLDWSYNPSMALAFAVFDLQNLESDGSVHAIDLKSLGTALGPPREAPRSSLQFRRPSGAANEFSFAQDSVHTYVQLADLHFWSQGVWPAHDAIASSAGAHVRKIVVPAGWKIPLGRMLWADNFDPVALMPNLDGVGRAVKAWPRFHS